MSFIFFPFRFVSLEEHSSKHFKIINSANLIVKHGIDRQMKIIINLSNLGKVLVLHPAPCFAFATILRWIWEDDLINHNVVNIDFLFRKFNCQSFRLVHAQEFWNAYCNESCLFCIFKLLVDFLYLCLHSIYSIE